MIPTAKLLARSGLRLQTPSLRLGYTSRVVRDALSSSSRPFENRLRNFAVPVVLASAQLLSTEPHLKSGPSSGPPPSFHAPKATQPPPQPEKSSSPPKDSQKNLHKDAQMDAQKDVQKDSQKDSQSPHQMSLGAKEPVPARGVKPVENDDDSLTTLATKKTEHVKTACVKKEENKLTLWQKVKKEVHHYWDGTKLLATEVNISWRLASKMASGYELSRRENKQLRRTVQDLGRLVPFSVFIIVPLGEILLPFALKLFPNLLPSTYEAQHSKDTKAKNLRATRKDVSDFLRTTLKESGLPLSSATAQTEEFAQFFRKVRSTGEKPTNDDVIKVCKIFRDDLTLDNLSRPQLVSICRYMNLNTFGTDMMLRYQVRHRMRQIKRDDKAISYEGVDSLTPSELLMACASRGIRTHGVSPAKMRTNLEAWLNLRLKEQVPSTLLVMSNAYMYNQYSGEGGSQIEALVNVLSSIPEELLHEIELEVHNSEGVATNKQRLEVLKEQQELIEEENEQAEESESTGFATPQDVDNIDEKEERQNEATAAGMDAKPAGDMVDTEREHIRAQAISESLDAKIDSEKKS